MTAPRGKLCAFVLVASLAVNLFLGGLFASRWFRRPTGGYEPGAFSVFRLRRALGPTAAPTVDKVWSRHESDLRSRMLDASQARERATRALSADPFDAAEANAALADFRTKTAAAQAAMHGAVVELASELTPDQRRQLATAVDRPGPGGGPGARGGHRRRLRPSDSGNLDEPLGLPTPLPPSAYPAPPPSR